MKTKLRRRIRQIVPIGRIRRFKMKSTTRTDAEYLITLDPTNGKCNCSCPAAQFNPGKLCKHGLRALAWQERHQPQAAYRAEPPYNVRCSRCGSTTADNYTPDYDAAGEPVCNRWLCDSCVDVLMDEPADDFEQQANQGEAEYFRNLAMAESYGAFCEQRANEEAAEYEDEEGAPC